MEPDAVVVKVLDANVYLLPNNRAGPFAEAGAIIQVRAGAYADSLVAAGALAYWNGESDPPPTVGPPEPVEPPYERTITPTVDPPPTEELASASRKRRRSE